MADLTNDEKNELRIRPVVRTYRNLTNQQFVSRLSIARKMTARIDTKSYPDVVQKYVDYPMWGFYTDNKGEKIQRIYGIYEDNKRWYAHIVSAGTLSTNLGSAIPLDELVRVDRWSDDQLKLIIICDRPGIFMDPLGFLMLLREISVR